MHIHILGICGTFMGSLAVLAKELGHQVSGCDANVYPPMSTQLEAAGIRLMEGYDPAHLTADIDLIVVGNAMSRGNPMVEHMLNQGLTYTSGPQWLAEHVLHDKWVLAVAGTHGKTTTTSMLTWILEDAGMAPGYLIGGVPKNFEVSARLGETPFFVIEADEYDTAFFDKRSKFVHYRPRTVVLNNLEFDHADIFDDLAAIQRQFHHLVRIVPEQGRVICADEANLQTVLDQGCWTPVEHFSDGAESDWQVRPVAADGSCYDVLFQDELQGRVTWANTGRHNMLNGLAAIAAARHVGVKPADAIAALCRFAGVKRRMELLADIEGVRVYDDFAHHPTAITMTLEGLRKGLNESGVEGRILAVIEPRSNTMRMGEHKAKLAPACVDADQVLWYQPPGMDWNIQQVVDDSPVPARLFDDVAGIVEALCAEAKSGDQIVIMSNGGFAGIHQQLTEALMQRKAG